MRRTRPGVLYFPAIAPTRFSLFLDVRQRESSQASRFGLRLQRGGFLGRVERSTCSMARRLVSRFARA